MNKNPNAASQGDPNRNAGFDAIRGLGYVFILCDDIDKMKRFYQDLFRFRIEEETPGLMVEFRVGSLFLGLRPRGRHYDGPRAPKQSASVQLSFRVPPSDVDIAYETLRAQNIDVIEPPTNQDWPHRTLYFRDPENNILEVFADIHVQETISTPSGVHQLVES
ncbi:VOC family protein [uncultured Roseovarius sp.]|uniref:VOC family protein n=1 Tax=uncultured Roseovarius sp. TaxID=293344 RepID=UPI002627781C|nr:VOC family protein [uncultured Roseovarius sp.]